MSLVKGYLALIVGHTIRRSGAYGVEPIDTNEYFYNEELAYMIKEYGEQRNHEIEIFYRNDVGVKEAYRVARRWNPDALIELHFNAFNGEVRGTETLYSSDDDYRKVREIELAAFVTERIYKVFNRKGKQKRGLKNLPFSRGERGYWNVNQTNVFPSILIEPFFGDNKSDAKIAVKKKKELAEEIVGGFEDWLLYLAIERTFIEEKDVDERIGQVLANYDRGFGTTTT